MKRDQKFAFVNSSSHRWFDMVDMVESLKIAILIRKRTQMSDFSVCLFCYDIVIGVLRNFGERCQNSRYTANK